MNGDQNDYRCKGRKVLAVAVSRSSKRFECLTSTVLKTFSSTELSQLFVASLHFFRVNWLSCFFFWSASKRTVVKCFSLFFFAEHHTSRKWDVMLGLKHLVCILMWCSRNIYDPKTFFPCHRARKLLPFLTWMKFGCNQIRNFLVHYVQEMMKRSLWVIGDE